MKITGYRRLAAAIIIQGNLDLKSRNKRIRRSAETFFKSDTFRFYKTMIYYGMGEVRKGKSKN